MLIIIAKYRLVIIMGIIASKVFLKNFFWFLHKDSHTRNRKISFICGI